MALLRLTGKYAVGESAFAIVDDDMLAFLSQWRWKAKPNAGGNNIYAVRNEKVGGKLVTVRMHRVVAGLSRDDPLDVDHDNHNSLDNRRLNLKAATRSENILNMRRVAVTGRCQHCDDLISRTVMAMHATRAMTCDACSAASGKRRSSSAVCFIECSWCHDQFCAHRSHRRFCSEACRCRARYARRQAA